jgi:hypothetical protein
MTKKAQSRNKAMKQSVMKPVTVKDSRFGVRKAFFNTTESPKIATYMNPGRGNWTTR